MARSIFRRLNFLHDTNRASRLKFRGLLTVATIAMPVGCGGLLPHSAHAQTQVPSSNESQQQPAVDGAVHVPFKLYDGGRIVIDAVIDGRTIPSTLDTGSESVVWPASLQLHGKSYTKRYFFGLLKYSFEEKDVNGDTVDTRAIQLPSIRIGGFEAKNVDSYSFDNSKLLKDATPEDLFWRSQLLLADGLFEDRVLCIDYEYRELRIFLNDFVPTTAAAISRGNASAKSDQIQIMDFALKSGHPVIDATIDGVPARVGIDTGWGAEDIGITGRLYNRLRDARPSVPAATADQTGLYGSTAHLDRLPDVTVFVQPSSSGGAESYRILADATKTDTLGHDTDAMIGWGFLRHFRSVTLDFRHKKIYFEPWSAGSPQDRMGVYTNPAMAKTADRRQLAVAYGLPVSIGNALFGAAAAGASATHFTWIQWQGGNFGDLWDDGTFIPMTTMPSASPPITGPNSRGFIVKDNVSYVFWGDNSLSPITPTGVADPAHVAHALPPALGTVYQNGAPFVVLSDGTLTPLLARAPEPSAVSAATPAAHSANSIPGKHWGWSYPFNWALVANDAKPAPWPVGSGQGPVSGTYWYWADPGQWVALPDGAVPPSWPPQSAAPRQPPAIPPPPPGKVTDKYVWSFYYKVGWTQVPTPAANAARTSTASFPPYQAPDGTYWKWFSGVDFGLLSMTTPPGQPIAPPPPGAPPTGVFWYYYPGFGWALVPLPASVATPPI